MHSLSWNTSIGSVFGWFNFAWGSADHHKGPRPRDLHTANFPAVILKTQATFGNQCRQSNHESESFSFKVLSSSIHKNAAGVNGLKPPEPRRVWQFIIQQGFPPTQFSCFLFVHNRVFRAACGFRLSPSSAKLYSQMHQYLPGNHSHWQKKLFAFLEDHTAWSEMERYFY